ncbi:MAG: ComEC/Rec2 family competence protein [Candidatus Nanopelagicales bacterium]
MIASRLIGPALAAWTCALAAIVLAALSGATDAVVSASRASALILVVAGLAQSIHRRGIAVLLMASAAALLSASAYVEGVGTGPVVDAGASRRIVTVDAVISGDARHREGYGAEARAHVESLTTADGRWDISSPVLLRLADDSVANGSTVRVTGRASPGDLIRGYSAAISVDALEVVGEPCLLAGTANAVRAGLREALAGGDPAATALVAGLAVGDESTQPPGLADAMRASGLSHLTAVSGGNTALVVGAVLLVSALLGLGLAIRAGLALAALGAFVVVVGPQPSVLRAAAMGVIALAALLAGGRRSGIAALAGTALVLVVASPGLAVSWGFALSVAATAGLLVLSPPLLRLLRGEGSPVRRAVAEALALTIAAQIATLPLIAAFGQGISLVSVPANLLAAPAVAPVTILGLLAAAIAPASMDIARVLARCAEPFAAWIAAVAERSAALPGATLPWPGGLAGAALATVVAAVAIAWIRRRRGRHERLLSPRTIAVLAIAASTVAVLALRLPDRAGWPPEGWVLVACDVAQGDGLVLNAGPGQAVVVDTGPDPALMDRCLSDLGIERVDLLVLTHPHADHVDGVPGVLNGRAVQAALVSPLREPPEQAAKVDRWLAGIPVQVAEAGERRTVDGITLTTLWPQRIIRGPESAPNNASIVLLAEVGGVRLLLLGDVETSAQVALRSSLGVAGVDVVKVAHHGSRYQDPALAAWTGGRVAIICVGAGNDYGHPAPETLDQWRYAGAVIARTDLAGDVAVVGSPLGVLTRRTSPG